MIAQSRFNRPSLSLSLSLPPYPPFFPTPSLSFSLFLPLSVYPSIPERVYTSLPHALMFLSSLSVPLWFSVALLLSPHLSVCVSLYVGVSLCLSKSVSTPLPCPSFPSCLPPSFSLPEPLLQLPGVPCSPATLHIFLTLTYYLCCCHFWLWATANRM